MAFKINSTIYKHFDLILRKNQFYNLFLKLLIELSENVVDDF